MNEEHLCPEHNKPMLESKHRAGEFYCPVKVGDHPQSGKALYCTHVWKPGDTPTPPTPAPPPPPVSQPAPPPPPPVQYKNDKGPQLFIQWSVRTAAHVLAMKSELPPDMEEVKKYARKLRQLVREEQAGKPHWIADEKTRKKFWAWTRDTLALENGQIHEALRVGSLYDFEGSKADAVKLIQAYVDSK